MINLSDFLQSAPKKFVSQLYKKHYSSSGVVQGKEVIQKVLAWACDLSRLTKILEGLGNAEKQLILSIYISEERGLLESDLYSLSGDLSPSQISTAITKFEDELLVCCRKGDYYSFHGFHDFFTPVVEQLVTQTIQKPHNSPVWISNQTHLIPHLISLLSQIQLGRVKCTQKGELHRRSLSLITETITSSLILSASVPKLELELMYQYLIDHKMILENKGTLLISTEGRQLLAKPTRGINIEFVDWWIKKRLCNSRSTIQELSVLHPEGFTIESFLQLFQPFSPGAGLIANSGNKLPGVTWDQLPSSIKELWIFGILQFAMENGKITAVKISANVREVLSPQIPEGISPPEEKGFSLPNFEILLPATSEPEVRFLIECLAERLNDENMTTYRFAKETIVCGMQSGISMGELEHCLTKLNFDETNLQTLKEWASTYESSEFKEVLLLKLKNKEHFSALTNIPSFIELTDETIPGYGFILPKRNKPQIIDFLNQFGLTPADSSSTIPPSKASTIQQETIKLYSSYFPQGKVNYPDGKIARYIFKEKAKRTQMVRQVSPPSQTEIFRILEYAILTEKKVELSYITENKKRAFIRPLHLLKDNDPVTLIATDIHTGKRDEYSMSSVTSLRIIE